MLEQLFSSHFLYSLSLMLLHFLWQGVLVALVLKSALLIFNNSKPQLRYALSALAMIANLLLPLFTFSIIYRAEIPAANVGSSAFTLSELIQELKQPNALVSYKELTEFLPVVLPYIALLWLVIISILASKLIIEIHAVNKLPLQGATKPSDELAQHFNNLIQKIHLKVTPQLLISLNVDVPMALGWLKPVVLLPASMVSSLTSSQLEMLILHELAHIRRHDYLVNFFQTLIDILLFFHPAVHWVSKQMRNEREYCSDDIAVQYCGDAVAYAHTLADTASLCNSKQHQHTIPNMAMAASGGDLKQRVLRLVDHHCAPQNNISKWFASITIIFSVLLLSSKQLLTIPLLDIWHDKAPWQQEKLAQTSTNIHRLNGNFPNNSIAQQLLTPIHQLPNEHGFLKSTKNLSVIQETNQQLDMDFQTIATNPVNINNNEQIALKKSSQTKKLAYDSAPTRANIAKQQPQELQLVTTDSSPSIKKQTMVKLAFEISGSTDDSSKMTNPYAEKKTSFNSKSNNLSNSIASTAIFIEAAPKVLTDFRDNNTSNFDASIVPASSPASSNTPVTYKAITSVEQAVTYHDALDVILAKNTSLLEQVNTVEPIRHNAKQLKSVSPVYPSLAKRKGIEIEVKVDFTIDVDGQIKNIQFTSQNKINYFKNSIRTAIKKWRFLPAKVDNQAVESQMTKVFAFSLQS